VREIGVFEYLLWAEFYKAEHDAIKDAQKG
jgi:hypothetical protein